MACPEGFDLKSQIIMSVKSKEGQKRIDQIILLL